MIYVEKSGVKQMIAELVAERRKFFDGCVPMQTILKITFRDERDQDSSFTLNVIYCLFVRQPAGDKCLHVSKDGEETAYHLLDLESIERA